MSTRLADRLWEAARREANRLGKPIDPNAEAQLKSMINQGVDRMRDLGVENDAARIQEAEKNIAQFVREMDKDAQRRGQRELDVASYNAARGICPLWPYCR